MGISTVPLRLEVTKMGMELFSSSLPTASSRPCINLPAVPMEVLPPVDWYRESMETSTAPLRLVATRTELETAPFFKSLPMAFSTRFIYLQAASMALDPRADWFRARTVSSMGQLFRALRAAGERFFKSQRTECLQPYIRSPEAVTVRTRWPRFYAPAMDSFTEAL